LFAAALAESQESPECFSSSGRTFSCLRDESFISGATSLVWVYNVEANCVGAAGTSDWSDDGSSMVT
jgi:hypothetical protein